MSRSCSMGNSRIRGASASAWVRVRLAARACDMWERSQSEATSAALVRSAPTKNSVMPGPCPASAAVRSIARAISRACWSSQPSRRANPSRPVATSHGTTPSQSTTRAPVRRAKATRSSAVGSISPTRAQFLLSWSWRMFFGSPARSSRARSGSRAFNPAAVKTDVSVIS